MAHPSGVILVVICKRAATNDSDECTRVFAVISPTFIICS
jgi:hypothetical protein